MNIPIADIRAILVDAMDDAKRTYIVLMNGQKIYIDNEFSIYLYADTNENNSSAEASLVIEI